MKNEVSSDFGLVVVPNTPEGLTSPLCNPPSSQSHYKNSIQYVLSIKVQILQSFSVIIQIAITFYAHRINTIFQDVQGTVGFYIPLNDNCSNASCHNYRGSS